MKSFYKLLFVFTIAFFAVTAINFSVGNDTNIFVLKATKVFAEGDGGDGGSGPGGNGDDFGGGGGCFSVAGGQWCNNTCTNGATNYPYCNNNVCTNGATNFPACNNQCYPQGTQTQYLTCPAGQTGQITQQRTHSCPANAWSAWTTTSNTCQNSCVPQGTQTQYLQCPSGQVGQITQQRTHTCPADTWGSWTTTYNTCQNAVCSNGATNFPGCNTCPAGKIFSYGQCIDQPTCSNGATNWPHCNNNQCTNGATNWPHCNNNVCTNGATNYPWCNNQCTPLGSQTQTLQCPYGQTGSITQTRTHSCPANTWSSWITTSNTCQNQICSNGATNWPHCNNNQCTNGATNFPWCNNNTCTNGTTNFPHCNQCPSGMTFMNGACTYWNPTCTNGATNYPLCNNNQCTNGATNFPSCNNNVVWCNGVQYYAGYICPTYNLAVSTTGANPLTTTATIYGYVNPFNNNATIWFDYGTSYSGLQYQTTRQSTGNAGQFTASLSNLQCGTRYYYRAAAQNNVETKYGSTLSFVTPACYNPVVYENYTITRLATKVGAKSAQLNGSFINNSGNISSCAAFFDYGTSASNLSKRTAAQRLYSNYTTNYFSQGAFGLAPNTTYYYRAGVTCNDGTKWGNIYSFRTGNTYVVVNKKKVDYIPPIPVTIVADNDDCNCEIPEYMTITIDAMEGEATIGKTANYRINFKNVSESAINNVVVRVVLPDELTLAGADKGQFTKGGKTLILTIPMLRALEEGSIIVSTNVLGGAKVGQQIVVNAYADYTTPTLKKSGTLNKGEVTAYTISVAGNGTAMNPNQNNGGINTGNNINSTAYPDWMPQNLLEWLLFILVIGIFFTALRYIFTAFGK